ncbi:alpha-L-fucosidase 2 [Granulicella pectinivorans]|uniref:Alpha-L-fucosidase 2 n=2 Tax=Granulicella pectinivorans TaxID=474950 RepID=A0A1I6MXJ8_9BACT|nr:alpha-L-fucosidase 2 [Granulicella pectinivorans]
MTYTRRSFVRLMSAAASFFGVARMGAATPAGSATAHKRAASFNPDTTLWMEQPATAWQDALPVGNGRMGAMVFGGVAAERVALNDDTLWSGGPRDWNNPGAKEHLPVVRRLVLVDKNYQAADEECRKMEGPWNQNYEPLGDLLIDMEDMGDTSSYARSLDLDSAVAKVEFSAGGVRYQREVFASFPDDVILVRLTASGPAKITAKVRLRSLLHSSNSAQGRRLLMTGKAPKQSLPQYVSTQPAVTYSEVAGEGMYFASVVDVRASGGKVEAQTDGSMHVSGASSLVICVGCATGFRGFSSMPDMPLEQVVAKATAIVDRASNMPYAQLRARHVEDHRTLFRRVRLELPSTSDASLATDQRVEAFARNADPSMLVLVFNLGRYLLISSSRPGSQPANLQGLWNADVRPPWSSNWTTNINVEMNYWAAETCNLSECHLPLIAMVGDLSVNGAKTAEVNYGTPGWCAHHNVDLWRQSAPAGNAESWAMPTWANWPMAGVWLCAHLWEHYRFTGDKPYLRDVAYPVMRGAAEFCAGWLIDDGEGGLTTCPSVSPENIFVAPNGQMANVSAGATMDIALIREIFLNCTEAAKLLGVDTEFRGRMVALTQRLPPYKIGRFGQLQEWSIDFEEKYPGMRHLSHLYPLYPGEQITPRSTPDLAVAARKSLERRLEFAFKEQGAFTGWGRAWVIALWARLQDGDMAWDSLKTLVNHSLNGNLFDDVNDTHLAPGTTVSKGVPGFIFQIDANLGTPGGIAEMLMQSHNNEIALLPAIPADWKQGKVKGLRARGGLEASIEWNGPKASKATVQPLQDGTFRFRAPKGQRLVTLKKKKDNLLSALPMPSGNGETFELDGRKGESYQFTFASS